MNVEDCSSRTSKKYLHNKKSKKQQPFSPQKMLHHPTFWAKRANVVSFPIIFCRGC